MPTACSSAETGNARPLDVIPGKVPVATPENPPGLYGSEDGFTALNLLPRNAELQPIDMTAAGAHTAQQLAGVRELVAEAGAVHAGPAAAARRRADRVCSWAGPSRALRAAKAMTAVTVRWPASAFLVSPPDRLADDSRPDDAAILERLDTTHLAYVVTGESEVDRLSERGLTGLTDFLTYRTTLEPGTPVGLDITKDELLVLPDHLLAGLRHRRRCRARRPSAASTPICAPAARCCSTRATSSPRSARHPVAPAPTPRRLQAILAQPRHPAAGAGSYRPRADQGLLPAGELPRPLYRQPALDRGAARQSRRAKQPPSALGRRRDADHDHRQRLCRRLGGGRRMASRCCRRCRRTKCSANTPSAPASTS